MFHSARLKLTGWYLLIIMVISIAFSSIIYRMLISEVDRLRFQQQQRLERRAREAVPNPPLGPLPIQLDDDLVQEIKRRLLWNLIRVNAVIVLISGGLGYFLAGKTLRPIQTMLDEQKRFVADSSHELRTPLTSLKTGFEVHLRDPQATRADAQLLIKESLGEVNKLQHLTDELLQLARHDQVATTSTETPLSLQQLLAETRTKVDPLAKRKSITLLDQTQDATLPGKKKSLVELLTILLDNAIKYSPTKSTITIRSAQSVKTLKLAIHNQGPGIEKKHLPHIFDRFYRADSSRSKTTTGYGLGLSIAKKIVENHHGNIKVNSHPKQGTTFTVSLPK